MTFIHFLNLFDRKIIEEKTVPSAWPDETNRTKQNYAKRINNAIVSVYWYSIFHFYQRSFPLHLLSWLKRTKRKTNINSTSHNEILIPCKNTCISNANIFYHKICWAIGKIVIKNWYFKSKIHTYTHAVCEMIVMERESETKNYGNVF